MKNALKFCVKKISEPPAKITLTSLVVVVVEDLRVLPEFWR